MGGGGGGFICFRRQQPSKLHPGKISVRSKASKTHREPHSDADATPSDRCFIENGARLLEALVASCRGNTNPIRMYSERELAEATDNYDEGRFLGSGLSLVYGGVHDGRPIAVKTAAAAHPMYTNDLFGMFLNEVVSLSQINHRNVVRLLGCCIDSQVPILVYEFIPGGNLYHHLHHPDASRQRIAWKDRLRIALEVADALNYLHTGFPTPIVHGNVLSSSIFLDDGCSAKVGTFGFSEVVRREEMRAKKCSSASGSRVSFELEHESRQRVTEKDDIYRFGLVLIELLTGKKTRGGDSGDAHAMLLRQFLLAARQDMLGSVLDGTVLREGDPKQLMGCAWVAIGCVLEGKPTMKELVQELRRIRSFDA